MQNFKSKTPVNHAVCKTVDHEEILNQVQNDSYEDMAVCHPCKILDTKEILNQVQNDSYGDLAVCKSRRLDDMKKTKTLRKRAAFTLAETLIAIGIIGVVAALTIPNLQKAYKAHRLRSQFNKSYSTIKQAALRMEDDGYALEPIYGTHGFYKMFAKYLNVSLDCGTSSNPLKNDVCMQPWYENYRQFDHKRWNIYIIREFDDGQLVLNDGTNLYFEDSSSDSRIFISVDLNGYSTPPNIWGYDLFTFEIVDGKVLPMGALNTWYYRMGWGNWDQCCFTCSGEWNGLTCAKKASSNTDYFKLLVKNIKM